MSFDSALRSLKAAADPTRLRILALLSSGEATVGELQAILAQSQPRVSRHLRLLVDGGLVTRFRDGHWVYYRLASAPDIAALIGRILELADRSSPELTADRKHLSRVKREREREAYAGGFGRSWSRVAAPGGRPDPASVMEAIEDAVGDREFGDVLDVGCGGGALLCRLGVPARRLVGVDHDRPMRLLARSRVHQASLPNCTVRDGDLLELPFEDASFDLVLLDEVLSRSRDPRKGLAEARRVLAPSGCLLILDRIHPVASRLAANATSGGLIENQTVALLQELGCRIIRRSWFPGRALEYALFAAALDSQSLRTGTDD
jgi:DNA-binding transcriptional ArsR family regulator